MKHSFGRAFLVGALACPFTPGLNAINVSGDQVVCSPGQTISESNIVADVDGDIARVTGGQLTLSNGISLGGNLSSGETASLIQSGGDLDIAQDEIDIMRNRASGDVYFEISGGKFNSASTAKALPTTAVAGAPMAAMDSDVNFRSCSPASCSTTRT